MAFIPQKNGTILDVPAAKGNDSLPTEVSHSRERHGDYAGKISGRSAARSELGGFLVLADV